MKQLYTFCTIAIIALSSLTAEAAKPKWVKKRPSERDYYVGIGMAHKNQKTGLDYAKKARADALRELVSEIEVSVSSNSLLRQFEDNYAFKETFESEIETSAEQNLTGYEVQTWENKSEYWVFTRLNKEQYRRGKQLELEMAKKKAAMHLMDARNLVKDKKITAALGAYFNAIESPEHHLKDDLTYRSIEGNINFATDLSRDLRELFSHITITPTNPDYYLAFSKNMERPLKAKIEYFTPEGQKIPVQNLPVNFNFTEGSGILQQKVTSSREGEVSSYIQKLESSKKKQQVTLSFDHTELLQEQNIESSLVTFFLPSGNIPRAKFNIELQKSDAWFNAREVIFKENSSRQPFSSQLKSYLNETFFNFTHSSGDANYIVEVKVDFKKGEIKEGAGYTVYLVFADLYISILSADTKTEIFSDAVTSIKGMRPGSYDYALKEARQKLLQRFRDKIYPQLEAINL